MFFSGSLIAPGFMSGVQKRPRMMPRPARSQVVVPADRCAHCFPAEPGVLAEVSLRAELCSL